MSGVLKKTAASPLSRDGEADNVGFWLLFPYSYEGAASSTVSGTSVQTVRFSGNSAFSGGNVSGDSLQINAHEGKTSGGYSYRWHDSGYIEIEIPATGNQTQEYLNHLPSGTYSSDIYIHIVTDFNI